MIFVHKKYGWIVLAGFTFLNEYSEFTQAFGRIMFPGNIKLFFEDYNIDQLEIKCAADFFEKYELIGII